MKRPSGPPQIDSTKDARGAAAFDRWLYLFWEWTSGSIGEGDQNVLVDQAFGRRPPPPERPLSNMELHLAIRSMLAHSMPPLPPVDEVQARIAAQVFGPHPAFFSQRYIIP